MSGEQGNYAGISGHHPFPHFPSPAHWMSKAASSSVSWFAAAKPSCLHQQLEVAHPVTADLEPLVLSLTKPNPGGHRGAPRERIYPASAPVTSQEVASGLGAMKTGSATPFLAGPHPHPPLQGPEQVSSLSPAQLLPGGKEGKLVAQCASGLFWFSCNLSNSHQPCVVNLRHLAHAVGHTPRAIQETLKVPQVTCEPCAQTTSIRSHR